MAAPPRTPWQNASHNREVVAAPHIQEVRSDTATFTQGAPANSSYPHRTAATPSRAAHVTDVRFVTSVDVGAQSYNVLERFHQDDVSGAQAVHDRFIAVTIDNGSNSGVVHNVAATYVPPHLGARGAVPQRDDPLSIEANSHLQFAPLHASGDPPLSPRSRRRALGDGGH